VLAPVMASGTQVAVSGGVRHSAVPVSRSTLINKSRRLRLATPSATSSVHFTISEAHVLVIDADEARVRDRDFEDKRARLAQARLGVAHRRAVDVPGKLPELHRHRLEEPGIAHRIASRNLARKMRESVCTGR
jgi:hypothetical protein